MNTQVLLKWVSLNFYKPKKYKILILWVSIFYKNIVSSITIISLKKRVPVCELRFLAN